MAIDVARLANNLEGLLAKQFPRRASVVVDPASATEMGDSIWILAHFADVLVPFSEPLLVQHFQSEEEIGELRSRCALMSESAALEAYRFQLDQKLEQIEFSLELPGVEGLRSQLAVQDLQSVNALFLADVVLRLESPNLYQSCAQDAILLTELGLTIAQLRKLWETSQALQMVGADSGYNP